MIRSTLVIAALLTTSISNVHAVSSKMDFLTSTVVRTDPIVTRDGRVCSADACHQHQKPTSKIQNSLSDHIHSFYGVNVSPRPDMTYEQMRAETENTGNVRENKSLYWHPSVYKVNQQTGEYTLVDTWFASAYYIWKANAEGTVAFPDGFRMIARAGSERSRVVFTCDGESACERPDGCNSNADANTFPQSACAELEIKIVFPVCWNGGSWLHNHMSHASYDIEQVEGSFDGECPTTHPQRVPKFNSFSNPGLWGEHRFSTDDRTVCWLLVRLELDGVTCVGKLLKTYCRNPDAWCNDVFTFTDEPKTTGDSTIVERLNASQPTNPLTSSHNHEGSFTGFTSLPRGARTGTLIGGSDSGGGGSDTGGSDDNTMVIATAAAGASLVFCSLDIHLRSIKAVVWFLRALCLCYCIFVTVSTSYLI